MHHILLAVGGGTTFNGNVGSTPFWDTAIGHVLSIFLGVLGFIVVIVALVRTIGHVSKGEVSKAVKGAVGSVLLAAILFSPQLIGSVIGIGGNVWSDMISTVSSITGSSSPGTPGGSTGGGTPSTTQAPATQTSVIGQS
jgi:hypothetical protein